MPSVGGAASEADALVGAVRRVHKDKHELDWIRPRINLSRKTLPAMVGGNSWRRGWRTGRRGAAGDCADVVSPDLGFYRSAPTFIR